MLCQLCNHNEANMHYTTIVNGKLIEKHLCEDCGKKETGMEFNMPLSLGEFLGELLNIEEFYQEDEEKVCPVCGITYDKFLDVGKFGCSKCFYTFEENISALLKNIHGQDVHVGKIPSKMEKKIEYLREKDLLKKKLNQAVMEEEYEEAVKYRDQIKLLDEKIDIIKIESDKGS